MENESTTRHLFILFVYLLQIHALYHKQPKTKNG